MSDKYQGNGYYKPEPKAKQNQSTTIYIVIIVVLALLVFALCVSMGKAEEKYNKLASYATQLEEQIEYMNRTAEIVSQVEKSKETTQTTVAPVETTKITTTTEPTPKSKYDIKYISHKVDYDRSGNPVLLVTYEFTNNSDENASWTLKVHDKAFQNGVECGGIVFHDDINSQMQLNEIQPGTTVTIVDGYPLYDNENVVTIECGELFGDEPILAMDVKLVE